MAFDKHMNLLMQKVTEEYTVRLRVQRSKTVQRLRAPGMLLSVSRSCLPQLRAALKHMCNLSAGYCLDLQAARWATSPSPVHVSSVACCLCGVCYSL